MRGPWTTERTSLLAENVERISGDRGQFDVALHHLLADDGRGQEVSPILREDPGPALTTDLVARPPDSLQARGDRYRGLDLDHQVDGSHVDPEFKGGSRDHRLELAPLEGLLDQNPLLAGHRPVVGAADFLTGQGVDLPQMRSAKRRELANRIVERWV